MRFIYKLKRECMDEIQIPLLVLIEELVQCDFKVNLYISLINFCPFQILSGALTFLHSLGPVNFG